MEKSSLELYLLAWTCCGRAGGRACHSKYHALDTGLQNINSASRINQPGYALASGLFSWTFRVDADLFTAGPVGRWATGCPVDRWGHPRVASRARMTFRTAE